MSHWSASGRSDLVAWMFGVAAGCPPSDLLRVRLLQQAHQRQPARELDGLPLSAQLAVPWMRLSASADTSRMIRIRHTFRAPY